LQAILDAMEVERQVRDNWLRSKYGEANEDLMEHRSKTNNIFATVNELMFQAPYWP
jgi:uncharacterized coiled-coil DUF342 family protein